MLAPGKQATRLGKKESGTIQQTFWSKNYGHCNKVAQLLAARLGKIETGTIQQTFWGKNYTRRHKNAHFLVIPSPNCVFGDSRRQIAFLLGEVKLENGFRALIERWHPDSRPNDSGKMKLRQ